jgi:SPP1 gp7 family putative phage head morphogenesis protein
MGKKDENYWKDRATEREEYWYKQSREKIEKDLARQYRQSAQKIQDDIAALYGRFAKENGLSLKEATALLKGNEFKEWRYTLEEYNHLAQNNNAILKELNTLAMRSRISRLDKLYSQTLMELNRLGEHVEKSMTNFLSEAYRDNYYKGLFEIGKTAGIHGTISAVDNKRLEDVLRTPWSGKNYSARIWDNQKKLAETIKQTVFDSVHRGVSVPKLSKMVQDRMGVGKYEATRLVRTELNYVHNQANLDSIKDSGMEFYKFVATLDSRTSQKCRSHDGSIVPVEEASPGDNLPPLHPHCRSTIIGSLGVGKGGQSGKRIAKGNDGKTLYIPQQMAYKDYKAVYIDKTKPLATWAKENSFKGIVSKPALPAKAEPKRSDIQFINMDGANWDKTKVLLEELSSEYETKLKTVEHKADRMTIQKGPGEVDITSSAMRLSSGLNEITVHEFAHTLAVEKADKLGISDNRLFWNEIRKIRTAYRKARAKNPNISISAYADNPGKNPLDEFMAEAFTHAKCAEKGIKISGYGADYTYSNQVLETINKYFKRAKVKYSGVDVMQEYAAKAKPKQGHFTLEDNFRVNEHVDEVRVASLLFDKFGGDWKLCEELGKFDTKNPDFIWNGKAWDLKKLSTLKSADSAVRKGIKQIVDNSGGLMLEVDFEDLPLDNLIEIIDKRMKRSIKKDLDVIIIHKGHIKAVRRYKKKTGD